ncbi:unnamed protein product [Rotaria sp. Silwood1]|nr:unnamed protein product [Rotaria sp. Silwood1]
MAITDNLPSFAPFQNVQHLVIVFQQSTSTLRLNLLRLISMYHEENDKISTKRCVNVLKSYVDLSTINKIDVEPKNDISQLYCIEQILLLCSNLTELRIGAQLFLSFALFDNPSLISVFNQLQRLELIRDNIYFSLKYASKLTQHFPSLTNIELQVYSFDACVRLADILLDGLINLLHLKIDFVEGRPFDNPNLRDYVIEKRYQAFPFDNFNEDRVVVILQEQSLEIYL